MRNSITILFTLGTRKSKGDSKCRKRVRVAISSQRCRSKKKRKKKKKHIVKIVNDKLKNESD